MCRLIAGVVILVVACGWRPYPPAPERMIAIFIVDGLRPDSINLTDSPTIARLRSEGVEYVNSHSLFPTVTRLNATALVTGAYPDLNGIVGNSMFVSSVNPRAAFDNGDYKQVLKLEDTDGRAVTTETLGEILQRNNRKLVTLSSGSTGVGFLLNPNARHGSGVAIHGLFDRGTIAAYPKDVSDAILQRFGAPPAGNDELALMNWTDPILRDFVLPELRPDVMIDWIGPLDGTQHAIGPGSPQAKEVLRQIDESISKTISKLRALGLEDRLDILVASDHGFAQNTLGVNASDALVKAGLKKAPDSTDVVVASQGQSLLLYVAGRDPAQIEKIVRFLQQQSWIDVIFTAGGKGDQGRVPGTFSMDLIHASHPKRGPDVIASLAWTSQTNTFGVPGTNTTNGSRTGALETGAGHGGLSPWVVHNTFIADGVDFKRHTRVDAPVYLTDVTPTILTILMGSGGAKDKDHGRVLEELLNKPSTLKTSHRIVKTSAGAYKASLEISTVAGHDYVDGSSKRK
jgi:predicted AlkP superfamily pyrophosphatase or phosphodiesterase